MNSLYTWLVILHIFSAIVGVGPGFVLTTIVKNAKTMTEIRFAFQLKMKVHIFVIIGGMLVLITGLIMGALKPILFQQGWYVASMLLYFSALLLGPTLLKRFSKPIKSLLADQSIQEVPKTYYQHVKRLLQTEYVANTLLLIVIFLMITKPF